MPVILIVEDDPALANLYDEIFKRDGFDTLVARDGQMGLDMAILKKPDFILLDVMLPKLNGLEMFQKLNAAVEKKIPVMFLTNDTKEEEHEKAMKLGAKEYIAKARYEPEEIVNRVKKHLGMISG